MNIDDQLLENLIDQLIASNQACHECLSTSAQAVADLALRDELQAYANTHEVMSLELARLATTMALSACQRQLQAIAPAMPGRSSFQYALVTKDRYAILAECQQRLCATLECYDEILQAKLPEMLTETLQRQSDQIQQAYSKIHHMCVQAQPQFARHINNPAPTARRVEAKHSQWPAKPSRPMPLS